MSQRKQKGIYIVCLDSKWLQKVSEACVHELLHYEGFDPFVGRFLKEERTGTATSIWVEAISGVTNRGVFLQKTTRLA